MLKQHLQLGAAVTLQEQFAFEQRQQAERRAEFEATRTAAIAQVEEKIAEALPNADANWRNVMPLVLAEVAGKVRTDLSRQEKRSMERVIAKSAAALQHHAARREKRLERKRRRAGV